VVGGGGRGSRPCASASAQDLQAASSSAISAARIDILWKWKQCLFDTKIEIPISDQHFFSFKLYNIYVYNMYIV